MKLIEPENNPLKKLSSLDSLCRLLQVKKGHLLYICYSRHDSKKYKSFDIPKKRGGQRKIDAPLKGLALTQRKLAALLSTNIEFKDCVTGFVAGQSICKNAEHHKKSKWILNVDIQDFFNSINFGRIRGMFIAKPFEMPAEVATVIAQICTFQNRLPQGAATSPVVANMIASMLDSHALRLARTHRLKYSRYADDITFSSRRPFPKEVAHIADGKTLLGEELKNVFDRARFTLNPNKSRLQHATTRQEVTGLIVNKKLNVPAEYKNKLRSAIKQWTSSPAEAERYFYLKIMGHDATSFVSEEGEKLKRNIYGRLSFMAMVKGPDDPTFIKLVLKMAESDPSPPKFVQAIKREHKMYDVFLCHASEDKETIAKPLYDELEKLGLTVFLDQEDIKWGESLVDVINKALYKSKYVIAIITDKSIEKSWPQKEINAVLNQEIKAGTNKLLPLISGNEEELLTANFLMSDKLFKTWKNNPEELATEVGRLIKPSTTTVTRIN